MRHAIYRAGYLVLSLCRSSRFSTLRLSGMGRLCMPSDPDCDCIKTCSRSFPVQMLDIDQMADHEVGPYIPGCSVAYASLRCFCFRRFRPPQDSRTSAYQSLRPSRKAADSHRCREDILFHVLRVSCRCRSAESLRATSIKGAMLCSFHALAKRRMICHATCTKPAKACFAL